MPGPDGWFGRFIRCRGRGNRARRRLANRRRIRSGTNAWAFLTVDVKNRMLYVPLGSPTSDFYGADRHGDNLYGNCLVALDVETGKVKWHRQLVHHDLWDFDPAAPPILFEAQRGGRALPAVAQITQRWACCSPFIGPTAIRN